MIRVFSSVPNYDKYTYNARALQRIKGAWNNKVFGGSVLKPIKASMTGLGGIKERKPGGGKLEKKVPLKKLIEEADIDTGNGGSFYCLKNVKASVNTFLDIEIMVTDGIPSKEDRRLLEKWHTISALRSKLVPSPNLKEKLIAPWDPSGGAEQLQSKIDQVVNKTKSKKDVETKVKREKQLVTLA